VGEEGRTETPIEPVGLETHAEPKQIAYVRSKIEKNIKGYGSSGCWTRFWALFHKIAGSVLAGATTILIGIKPMVTGHDPLLSSGALITSALVTVLATWDALFDSRWLWLFNIRTRDSLIILIDRLNYAENTHVLTMQKLDQLHGDLISLVEAANREWAERRGHAATPPSEGSKQ
jgi:hypothetical protein